jgi:3-hydroxyisobutyrate dehydrogenase-like beta-hydroxyacid dehydrogenase
MMRVGFVGLGQMGRHMAASLIRAGYQVTGCDIRPEAREDPVLASALWADSPRAVAEANDVLITSLPGPDQVDEVFFGPDGVLSVMAGGSDADYAACLPVLQAMGEKIFLVGDVGAGHVAKLVNNMMTIINGLTAMEAMVVGAKAGLDLERLLEVVEAGTGGSYSLNVIRYVIFRGNFDPAKFALSLAAKDLRIAVEYADEIGVEMYLVPHAAEVLAAAMAEGMADRDWSSYITLIERGAGVEVRA